MKASTKLKLFAMIAAAGFMASASATPLYGADKLLGSADLPNSGDATELAAFQQFVPSLTSLDKSADNVFATQDPTDPNYWYIDLGAATPGYFLLKFGTGNTNAADTYFFQNLSDMTKLVFSSADVGGLISGNGCSNNGNGNSCNIGRLSHYATGGSGGGGGGNGGEVPEPASLALLGLGLAGMALRLRRR